jgi:hypothetical protein
MLVPYQPIEDTHMTSFEIAMVKKPSPSFRVTYSYGKKSESYIVSAPDKGQARMRVHLYASRTFGAGHYAGWEYKVSAYRGGIIESNTTDLRS